MFWKALKHNSIEIDYIKEIIRSISIAFSRDKIILSVDRLNKGSIAKYNKFLSNLRLLDVMMAQYDVKQLFLETEMSFYHN